MGELVAWLRSCLDEDEASVLTGDCRCGDQQARRPDCPDRVLDEIGAKKKVLDLYEACAAGADAAGGTVLAGAAKVRLGAYAQVIRELALLYAGRPGWREQWRPAE